MYTRHPEPSSSWVINQAFFSTWVAFAAGIGFVAFCLVPPSGESEPTVASANIQSAMPQAGSYFLVPPVPSTRPESCQLVVKIMATHGLDTDRIRNFSDDNANLTSGPRLWLHRMGPHGSIGESELKAMKPGIFSAVDLMEGTYHLTAMYPDRTLVAGQPWSCVGDGEQRYREMSYPLASAEVTGRLRGYQNSYPAAGEILIQQEDTADSPFTGIAHVPVREDGSFSFRIPGGTYRLLAVAPHHTGSTQELRINKRQIRESTVKRLNIQLEWRPEAQGRVLDLKGNPVAGADVYLGPVHDPRVGFTTVRTNEHGEYAIPILTRQASMVVSARYKIGFGSSNATTVNGPEGITGLDVVLHPGRELNGFVQEQSGHLKPYAQIIYRVRAFGVFGEATASQDGSFNIKGLPKTEDVELWPDNSALGAWGGAIATPDKRKVLLTYKAPAF